MTQKENTTVNSYEKKALGSTTQLRNPCVAAWLAWLIPGLGHLYQGRRAKAAIYAICILSLFIFGAVLSSGKCGPARCVYISLRPGVEGEIRYYYFAQMWVGMPAFPAVIQYCHDSSGETPLWNGLMAPPVKVTSSLRGYSENDNSLDNIRKKLNRRFEIGTLMTTMAGLLNIFAIFDTLFGPVDEEKEENERQKRLDEKRRRRRERMSGKRDAEEI